MRGQRVISQIKMRIIKENENDVTINPTAPHIVVNGDLESGHKFYGPFDNLDLANEFIDEHFGDLWATTNAFELSNPSTNE